MKKTENNKNEKLSVELGKIALLSFIILPLLLVMCVGAYGLVVWLLQIFVIGLPTA
ncbi:nitrate/trimethylamine N-oxide reductase NapE/TorE [Mergibacter septicus]|uniref:nitrate/trimethylamine N-oxide reductase NapE/TorE n=1 Tax=Mergibacter septicus TaxID=221402 RepID=UPI001C781A1F|nr:nitrate/trimethylamine N-oxide reductase NapE/TorE [Mergibacter septicus]QDJ13739.1 nitrate/trimethylamine N-oxide reductase NapE/TorE [Mergibacter septicus]